MGTLVSFLVILIVVGMALLLAAQLIIFLMPLVLFCFVGVIIYLIIASMLKNKEE